MLCSDKPVNINAKTKPHFTQNIVENHQNIQKPGIEMFKVVKGGNSEIVNEIYHARNEGFYELR